MAGRGLARNTIVRVRATLVLALTHAERRSMVARNVARLAELPVGAKPAPEGRSLTVDQAHILLDAARCDPLEALWVTGLMLGLRPGELTGLLWIDVDLDAATLQVRRSLKNESTGLRLGEPKTRRSYRGLDLPPQVVDALDRHRRRQRAQRQLAGPAWIEHGLVFTTSVGTALDPANLRRSFSALDPTGRARPLDPEGAPTLRHVIAVRRRRPPSAHRRRPRVPVDEWADFVRRRLEVRADRAQQSPCSPVPHLRHRSRCAQASGRTRSP